jgi:hypothetical protein
MGVNKEREKLKFRNENTREVLFEKTKYFWVRSLFGEGDFMVRRGKIKDFDINYPSENLRKRYIDEGFFTVTEGNYEDCYILKNNVKRIKK